DMVIRSAPSRNNQKIAIIQAIDRKIALDEIAESRGIEFEDLLDEIESIVDSGNKINISYYISEILDDDQQQEIFDYLREGESDDITEAVRHFGDEYTEDELRLMRVKFLSELGN
ncbi:MAG: helix-turn-helix domain-containing protein, partial [Paramuribaculum sp.]|nr:helix-turn-helix domain-containing protein [Paramuribaculum sp.]